MKMMRMLLSFGLLCGCLAFAQDSPGGQMANPNERGSAGANAFRGCLSGADGNFTLTLNDTGTNYALVGDPNKLNKHVGQEVAVTGKLKELPSSSAQPTADMNGQAQPPSSGTTPALKVSHIEMIAKTCKQMQ